MKRISICLLMSFFGVAGADIIGPTASRIAISNNGDSIVRFSPFGIRSIHVWNKGNEVYEKRELEVPNVVSLPQIFQRHYSAVNDAGTAIAEFDLGYASGVLVTNLKTGKARYWKLSDILTDEEMEACARTTTTIQWVDSVRFENGSLSIYGPSEFIRGMNSSFSLLKSANMDSRFQVEISLDPLELIEDKKIHNRVAGSINAPRPHTTGHTGP